jgi:hypothetical protein
MDNKTRMVIRKILIIFGLLFILISIAIGVSIVIFSFKFMGGSWLPVWKYILSMIGLAIAGLIIAIIGILIIYLSVDTSQN